MKSTIRVSVSSAGDEVFGWSMMPALSGDGRWVGFTSESGDLVPEDPDLAYDVFVHGPLW